VNSFDDELRRHLASLDTDLGPSGLPGAAAARKRGTQRARHQLTAAALGAAAVVAVGALGIIQTDPTTAPAPATTPSETVTTTAPAPTDSASPQPSDTLPTVPAGALLTLDDLPGIEEITWAKAPVGEPFACVPQVPDGAASVSFRNSAESDARIDQFVELVPGGRAEQRLTELRNTIVDCVETGGADYRLDETWTVGGVGDETWLARYWAPPRTPDTQTLVLVNITRTGDYVSTVVQGGPAQDANAPADPELAVAAATRLCEAIGEVCVGELTRERLYPEAAADVAGWLGVDDVIAATGLDEITEGSEVRPADDMGWGLVGLPLDPIAAGALTNETRSYFNTVDPTGDVLVTEVIARFPDEAAARVHYDALAAEADSFQQEGDVVTNTGTISSSGYVGTTWRSENAAVGLAFVYGVVTRGDTVAAVTHSISSYENRDVTPQQMRDLLDRAGQRLADL
jgi:hypothetical protein